MQTIVPLPDSSVRGPLGIAHVPRLWLKRILAVSGRLPAGYLTGTGWDATLLARIGLDPAATFAMLDTRPTYLAFEAWIRSRATRLDPASIAAANVATMSADLDAEVAMESRAFVGLDDPQQRNMALLNALEDWTIVHQAAIAGELEPIVPAISSQSVGPLGLRHLPRFWLKALLEATGALYDGWKSGPASGFDTWFASITQIDLAMAQERVTTTLPSYLDYERWFAATAGNVGADVIADLNAQMARREKPEAVAARDLALLGIEDPSYRLSAEINDLVDWHTLHEIIV
jgi:hypothetical protein